MPPDTFWKPLVEVSVLTVDLPVLLLLQVDRPPLVVGHESILDLGTEVAAPQGGDHFADGRVRVGLGVATDGEEDVSRDQQHPCTEPAFSFTHLGQIYFSSVNLQPPPPYFAPSLPP